MQTQSPIRPDLARFRLYSEPQLRALLRKLVQAQEFFALSDQDAYAVLKTILDEYFQDCQ